MSKGMSEHPSYQDPNLINERKVKMWSQVTRGTRSEDSQDGANQESDRVHYLDLGGPHPAAINAYHESYAKAELGATRPRQDQRHFELQLGPLPAGIRPIHEEPSSHTVTQTELLLRKEAKLAEQGFPYGGEESALETSNTRQLDTERSYGNVSQEPQRSANRPSQRKETLNLSGTRLLLAH